MKLITNKDLVPLELYDLATDSLEQNNRINERDQQDRVKRMHQSIKSIFESGRSTKPYVITKIQKTKLRIKFIRKNYSLHGQICSPK